MNTIFVVSDVVCPWCYLGKRRLERALDATGHRGSIAVQWLPFELNPDMPPEGMPRSEYRARKFGAARAAELDARMEALGREEGVPFAFGRMERTPNTRRAHMLIARATELGRGDEVAEGLFRAYFDDARDVGDPEVLAEIGAGAGLDADQVRAALDSTELRAQVVALERRAAEMGISGVPFFVLEDGRSLSGAQPAETWEQVLGSLSAATSAQAPAQS